MSDLGDVDILEVINVLKLIGVDAVKLGKNGKNWLADIGILVDLAGHAGDIQKAVADAPKAIPELKDLSPDQQVEVFKAFQDLFAAIVAANK